MLLEDIITMPVVYKIWSEKGDKVYIGSTVNFDIRRSSHKCPSNDTNSRLLFDEYGKENCEIDIIEEVKEDEMEIRERYWIYFYGENAVNKRVPGRTKDEYRTQHKEQHSQWNKEWREKNRERLIAYDRERGAIRTPCPKCGKVLRRDSIRKHLKTMHL